MTKRSDQTPVRTKSGLPSLDVRGQSLKQALSASEPSLKAPSPSGGTLPNAALIYGVASAAMGAFALYHLFTGGWFTALLLLAVATILFGFAFYFIRYPS